LISAVEGSMKNLMRSQVILLRDTKIKEANPMGGSNRESVIEPLKYYAKKDSHKVKFIFQIKMISILTE
jgi:hypothetical protein